MRRTPALLFLVAPASCHGGSFAPALLVPSGSGNRRKHRAPWQRPILRGAVGGADRDDRGCDRDTSNGHNGRPRGRIRAVDLPDRRSALRGSAVVFLGLSSPPVHPEGPLLAEPAAAEEIPARPGGTPDAGARRLPDRVVRSLRYERVLGAGSYKRVYLVSATSRPPEGGDPIAGATAPRTFRYAMAVERLRNKRDVKNAFRGVRIPDLIREGPEGGTPVDAGDRELFETIVDWWVQASDVPEFAGGRPVFPQAQRGDGPLPGLDRAIGRTRSAPRKNFVGSRWMLSFKPVYETDLKRFVRNSPALYPVGGSSETLRGSPVRDEYWSEPVLMGFVLEVLRAGKLMHDAGVVHRDIKPKNIMVSLSPSASDGSLRRRPVIIDYGFSEIGSPTVLDEGGKGPPGRTAEKASDVCVVRPGQLKGEIGYVLVEDLANYRGCQRGDTYAMGKTLYEFIFGSAGLQEARTEQEDRDQEEISVEAARVQANEFHSLLFGNPTAGNESRFRLSRGAADCLLSIVRGLCSAGRRGGDPMSFADAETSLSGFVSSQSYAAIHAQWESRQRHLKTPPLIDEQQKAEMVTSFTAVFSCALVVTIIASLRSSKQSTIFGFRTSRGGDGDGNGNGNGAAARSSVSDQIVKRYLPAYLLAVFSDWAKGPCGYELYSSGEYYNYDSHHAYLLCSVVPFVSSMLLGPVVCGPLADMGGSKRAAVVFAIVAALGNVAKHFRDFRALVVGSILEGVSASLLFTAFDSWLVRSHHRGAPPETKPPATTISPWTSKAAPSLRLSRAFATAEYRNNMVAIAASFVPSVATGAMPFQPLALPNEKGSTAVVYAGGVLNAFDLSTLALLLCGTFIGLVWDEIPTEPAEERRETRPGSHAEGAGADAGRRLPLWRRHRSLLGGASFELLRSEEVFLGGAVCSLFETAMFVFAVSWTKAIASRVDDDENIPFGLVFATFMLGCMVGTSVYALLIDETKVRNETIGEGLLAVATCTFIAMASTRSATPAVFLVWFFLFEATVGVYFPMMGTLKSEIVPDCHRTTVCNLYRVPFNLFMVAFLWVLEHRGMCPESCFALCACMAGAAFFFQVALGRCRETRLLSRLSKQHEASFRDRGMRQKKAA
ncbi:unnamed protein product [Pseudo-nitzschia multistriata]|uniref:Molybdate-anion transporter n=1 Tax=Pseudo-nitzschia multistriata TaxID=183589 RepID=A0A448YXK6_9STRA|nr:unnamed protein product [Pseudo-nitzschia multistriata]